MYSPFFWGKEDLMFSPVIHTMHPQIFFPFARLKALILIILQQ